MPALPVVPAVPLVPTLSVGAQPVATSQASTKTENSRAIAYYVAFEGFFGWTIGKLITGTRVKRFDGGKPGFLQIVARTAARFIPFEPFSLLFSASNSGWHDSISGTRVVRVRR